MTKNKKVNGYATSDDQQVTSFAGFESSKVTHSELVTGGTGTYHYDQYGNKVLIISPTGGGAETVDVWD